MEIFHYLLSKPELNKNLGTDEYKSPLHFAAEVGNLEMVKALIEKNVTISYLKRTRKTAFHLAVASCNVEVADWLAERNLGIGPVLPPNRHQLESIFHFLARQKLPTDTWIKMLQICEKAVKRGSRFLERRALNGFTPLQIAIEEENNSAIAGFILSGPDAFKNTPGSTFDILGNSLIAAAYEFFEDSPINPNFVNKDNETIWHFCALHDAIHLAQGAAFLFPEKENLRLLNSKNLSALDVAFELRNFNVALELIKMHDNFIVIEALEKLVYMATWNGWHLLIEALIQEYPVTFAHIVSSSSSPKLSSCSLLHIVATTPVRDVSENNPKTLLLLLLKHFPHFIESIDEVGRTPLHLALECEFMEFFDWLAEAKLANPRLEFNVKDGSGVKFSDFLKEKGEEGIFKLLGLNDS